MLRCAPYVLLRLLVALVVAGGVALSLVDVRTQTRAMAHLAAKAG